ncbi:nitroreductase family deazaflavin-dependent oxidoreductase [Mycobacterium sp. OTB74]|jgi:deazaflavin-dependent oxidoreductase (nitroreductase family)|uniref:nitroreductase family deazaflavin-dependent oxidoreductase n=1 Tax=Mycobacterium sp. OTB74 TaxID=1853452 RepID=UPI002473ABA9|nr:nitroreductase family deazaflavin-dependent oxidoreductase [Mycobacterium sp. OTB74]MDH6243590.1 deazaflavin-dependent oxidoreductase (nitroreductase family) [Mycobacterium sp. OTB74]
MAFLRPNAAVSRALNPLVVPLMRCLPPFAVLHHRGRRTGQCYDTPVQAYSTPDGWVVGLAYDHSSAWVLNLLAVGGGEMTRAGRRYQITQPRRVGREALELLPFWAALEMHMVGIDDFLQFDASAI